MCVLMCKARGWHSPPQSWSCPILYIKANFPLSSQLTTSACLDSYLASGIPCLHLPCSEITGTLPWLPRFYVVLGIQILFLPFVFQEVFTLDHLLALWVLWWVKLILTHWSTREFSDFLKCREHQPFSSSQTKFKVKKKKKKQNIKNMNPNLKL